MAEEKSPRHGGCYDCGSKEEKILTSVTLPGEMMGVALCSKCIQRRKIVLKD